MQTFLHNQFAKLKKNKRLIIGFVNHSIGQQIQNELNTNYDSIFNYKQLPHFNFIVQADEFLVNTKNATYNSKVSHFNVYAGFQADRLAEKADLILPFSSPLEEVSTFYDLNGKIISTNSCLPGPTASRTSWKVLLALLHFFQIKVDTTSLIAHPIKDYQQCITYNLKDFNKSFFPNMICNNLITNYYKTNSVTRVSRVMSQITKQRSKNISI